MTLAIEKKCSLDVELTVIPYGVLVSSKMDAEFFRIIRHCKIVWEKRQDEDSRS